MAKEKKKTPYQLQFSPYKLAPSHPPPLPVGQADVGLSGIPADLFHSHSSGKSEEWHLVGAVGEPGFTGGWVNLAADRVAMFKKVHGTTYITGLVKSGTVPSNIFTLPLEYRPTSTSLYFATNSNNAYGALEVQNTGGVICRVGSALWFSLDCCFRAE